MLKKIVWSMAVCSTVFISSSYGEDFDFPTTSTKVKDAPTTSAPSATSNGSNTSGGGAIGNGGGDISVTGSKLYNKVNNNHAKNKNTINGLSMDAKNIKIKDSKIINNVNNNHATNENALNGISLRARD